MVVIEPTGETVTCKRLRAWWEKGQERERMEEHSHQLAVDPPPQIKSTDTPDANHKTNEPCSTHRPRGMSTVHSSTEARTTDHGVRASSA